MTELERMRRSMKSFDDHPLIPLNKQTNNSAQQLERKPADRENRGLIAVCVHIGGNIRFATLYPERDYGTFLERQHLSTT